MSEHEDLFAVYGAIDRAVKKNPDLASTVGRYLPGYAEGQSVGWFDDFVGFTKQHAPEAAFPPAHVALARLAGTPTSGRMAARRVHALSVAARVCDDFDMPDAKTTIANAHSVDGIRGASDAATTENLLGLLTDDDVYGSIDDWSQLIDHGVSQGLLADGLQVHGAASPCSGALVDVHTPGDPYPAAEMRTSFDTAAVTAPQAERFLEPSNWPAASDFWCLMEPIETTPRGTRVYHEIVSLNCATREQNGTWTAEAYLEFAFVRTGSIARVSYQLDPRFPNPQIDVDEGALTVQHNGDSIHVETVKRIRFTYPFNGPSLAMVMCALGYGGIAQRLVLDCAVEQSDAPAAGTQFPGTAPPQTVQRRPAAPKPRRPVAVRNGAGAAPANGAGVTDVMHDAVGTMQAALHDYVDAYDAMYTKMQSGSFKANDVMSGYSDMWSRYVRHASAFVGHGARMATAVRNSYPAASPTPPPTAATPPAAPSAPPEQP
jgi:hypothetical protein